MANNIANGEENRLLDYSLTNVELAACTSDPGETGSLTGEVSSTSTAYAREAVTFSAASSGSASPSADISFTKATASWGTITHIALVAKTGEDDAGDVRWSGPLTTSKVIDTDDTLVIDSADLTVSLN